MTPTHHQSHRLPTYSSSGTQWSKFGNVSNLAQFSFSHHCLAHSKQFLCEGRTSHGNAPLASRRKYKALWLRLQRMKAVPWALVSPLRFRQITSGQRHQESAIEMIAFAHVFSRDALPYCFWYLPNPCLVVFLRSHCQKVFVVCLFLPLLTISIFSLLSPAIYSMFLPKPADRPPHRKHLTFTLCLSILLSFTQRTVETTLTTHRHSICGCSEF